MAPSFRQSLRGSCREKFITLTMDDTIDDQHVGLMTLTYERSSNSHAAVLEWDRDYLETFTGNFNDLLGLIRNCMSNNPIDWPNVRQTAFLRMRGVAKSFGAPSLTEKIDEFVEYLDGQDNDDKDIQGLNVVLEHIETAFNELVQKMHEFLEAYEEDMIGPPIQSNSNADEKDEGPKDDEDPKKGPSE